MARDYDPFEADERSTQAFIDSFKKAPPPPSVAEKLQQKMAEIERKAERRDARRRKRESRGSW